MLNTLALRAVNVFRQYFGPSTNIRITSIDLPGAQVGTAYEATLEAVGEGAVTWALGAGYALPAGLSLDATGGGISGTPSVAGLVAFAMIATDAAGNTDTRALSILVAEPPALPTGWR